MVNREFAIIATFAAIMISLFGLIFQTQGLAMGQSAKEDCQKLVKELLTAGYSNDGGVAVSGANVYTTWTCQSSVLFTRSNDGGKTFANTMLLSTPNTNQVMNDNVSISASGNNVAIMWDSNKTGIVNPVIRTSSDGGNTFSTAITLNSTSGGANK